MTDPVKNADDARYLSELAREAWEQRNAPTRQTEIIDQLIRELLEGLEDGTTGQ